MTARKLSVVVPCFNEERSLETIVERVLAADRCGLALEIVIVDDGSSDRSVEVMKSTCRPNIPRSPRWNTASTAAKARPCGPALSRNRRHRARAGC